jgi:fatty acyl-CoA reductase
MANCHPIRDFYASTTILITGGTGFLGKALLEKLLRTFRAKKIILFVRRKSKLSANERLAAMFDDLVNNLRK